MGQKIEVLRQGHEGEPLVVIDDFVDDPDRLVEDAAMLGFHGGGPYYPGVRAAVPNALAMQFLSPISGLLTEVFGRKDPPGRFESFYSLVTRPPEALELIQRLPHYDGVEPDRIAVLHFLARADSGGTAFYRHRTTGFETITAERLPVFAAALKADLACHGAPGPGYIAGDTPIFQQIARHEGRFNRALIYRGHTLHCADIRPDARFSADPYRGRLTVNTFLLPEGGG